MLPYQAVAMDYAVASAGFHHQRPGGLPGVMGLPGPGPGLNPGLNPAFTHSWFVQTSPDICRQQQASNQSHLEPGILELRKEKSRDAARSRRGKENYEFYELAKMLPLPAAITSQLDKASIIRLTISYLKLRDFSGHGDPPWSRDPPPSSKALKGAQNRRTAIGLAMELFEQHQGTHILQSLDGFALSVAADGRFLYISETVSIYLGLSQVEMTGSSIFDYVHQADHAEIAEQLGLSLTGRPGQAGLNSPASGSEEGSQHGTNNPDVSSQMSLAASGSLYRGMDRAFCVRMKSTLTKRGCHFKSSGYRVGRNKEGEPTRSAESGNWRVVLMLCRLRPQYSFSHSRKSPTVLLGMVALAIALPPPSVHEIRLESDMFVTRINFDFRIAHCEPSRVSELLGYTAEELTGKNLYALCHGEDANKLRKCHVDLMNKGQVLTHYYRIMNKLGGYTWMQTCATVVCSSKNAEEQNIICVNYVISGREYPNTVMDCCQLEESVQGVKREETTGDPENGPPDTDNSGAPPPPPRHQAERTEPPTNTDSASSAPVPTSEVTHLTRLSDAQPLPLHTNTERTSPMPARRLKKRKHTTDCEDETERDEERRKTSSNPGAAISPAERDISKTNLAIPEGGSDATSVRDLENAMSKHLPSVALDGKEISHRPTDFSTDALLKQQQQKSTIQWIGTQNHHLNPLNRQIPTNHTSTPASALLRQLYANRESVIRSNFLGDGRTGGYYSGDGQSGPLPTPPGSEGSGYGEQLGHKGTDIGSLAYGGYADYHSAMTPPGSVSPRDKQQYALPYDNSAYSEALRHSYLGEAPLPLKPQAYSAVPGALDYASSLDQSQFFHPPSSFHLYHPQAHSAHASHAHQPDKSAPPNTNWYSAGS
ncbi:protein trachealess isoform X3 [Spodoptera frugiperda]|uniref:Protein trachealess isoform X3 n=1 Tax=Spodoptera frugiperda TaxID=7108 RepID=A0A9R0DZQ0_SPOFR|nr:protein trachealess isoform X3 [Spodoptera frugiperda]